MNLNEFQELSKRTMPVVVSNEDKLMALANYSMGLAGETGEVVDLLKKVIFHKHPMTAELHIQLVGEIGDTFHYLVGLCELLNISPEGALAYNIEKLKKRYPDGFSTERSVNRVD